MEVYGVGCCLAMAKISREQKCSYVILSTRHSGLPQLSEQTQLTTK